MLKQLHHLLVITKNRYFHPIKHLLIKITFNSIKIIKINNKHKINKNLYFLPIQFKINFKMKISRLAKIKLKDTKVKPD